MIKTVTSILSEEDLVAFLNGGRRERVQQIQELYESLETFQHSELLAEFCDGERETFNDDQMVISISLNDESSGTIDVFFSGSTYFGCEDMDRTDEHTEVVSFEVDALTGVVEFRSEPPEPIDRPPNEEF